MDTLTAQQRHQNMAAIRSKDTKPEMIVRRGRREHADTDGSRRYLI